jgi:hypothetical protein
VDSYDNLYISYYDDYYDDLKLASGYQGAWTTQTIDNAGNVGEWTSIAIDQNDRLHISYYDYTNHTIKYATNAITCEEGPVMIDNPTPSYYLSIQEAYDNALDGEAVLSLEISFKEDVIADENKSVTFEGGFDCSYTDNTGYFTTINGDLTINNGTVTIGNVIIK